MTMTAERADIVLRAWYRIAHGEGPSWRFLDRLELSNLFEAFTHITFDQRNRHSLAEVAAFHAEQHAAGAGPVELPMPMVRNMFDEFGWKPVDGSGATGLHECDSDRTHTHTAPNQEHTT